MTTPDIAQLEQQIFELTTQLHKLQRNAAAIAIADYSFATLEGETTLLQLFGDHDTLLVIHNMGQACRYCTLWADGFNGLLPHLESALGVVLVSKDAPTLQRQFANQRGWRFRLASHGGAGYIVEQSVLAGQDNMPGAVVYERKGNQLYRKNACAFGPGDRFCAQWQLLGLAGLSEAQWTPQFGYWQRPAQLEDGGANIMD